MNNGVCAVIVTYNRKDKLAECLNRLRESYERPEQVLIVDNASTDGTPGMVEQLYPEFDLLRLPTNVGGAGGFEAGMRQAYAGGHEYVWLFDDDAYVDPDCLKILLEHAHLAEVIVPIQIDQLGRKYGVYLWENGQKPVDKEGKLIVEVDIFAFVGPLIRRTVIEKIGFPRPDFFICADDIDYSLRIKNAGMRTLCVLGAVFYHDYGGRTVVVHRFGRESKRCTQPAWKNYYNIRNDILIAKEMKASFFQRLEVFLYIGKKFARASLGEIMYDKNFMEKWKYTLFGLRDGLLNRSGQRVTPVVK